MASRTVRKGVVSRAGFIESDDDLDEVALSNSNVSYQESVHNLIQLFQETTRDRKAEIAEMKNVLKKQQLLIMESEARSLRKEQQMEAAIQSLLLTRPDTSSLTNDEPGPSTTTAATAELHRPPDSFLGAEDQAGNMQVRPHGYNKRKLPRGCVYVKKPARETTLTQENERTATFPSSHIGKVSTPFSTSDKTRTHNPESNFTTRSYDTKKPTQSEATGDSTLSSSHFGMKLTPFSIPDSAGPYGQTTWPTASCMIKTATQPTAASQEDKQNGAPATSRTWDTPMSSIFTGTASTQSQKENYPISGSYGKKADATLATLAAWREDEESSAFPVPRVEDTVKPSFVADNAGTPGENGVESTPAEQKKDHLLSSGPQTEICHGQSSASETAGAQDSGSQTKENHSQTLASEIADAQDSLFVDDEDPEDPNEMPIPGHIIAEPYTEMVWIGDKVPKVSLRLVAPPQPGTSTLLFRKWNSTPVDNEPHAQYWQFGSALDDGTVVSLRPGDTVLDYSSENIKILAQVFFKLRHRRAELRRAWLRANKHASDIVAITPDPYAELPNRTLSAAARRKLDQFIPGKICVVVPATGRQGGMNRREKGSVVERRVLFLRGTRVVKKGQETWEMIYRTRGDGETKPMPEDIVFPKDEDTFLALYRFYSTLQEADIIVPDGLRKRPAPPLSFDDVAKKAKFP